MVQSANPALAGRVISRPRTAARLGRRLTTTPGRMRLASVAIIVALLALAVVGTGAVHARQRATDAVGQQAGSLLVGAEVIYSSLADADATATNIFLKAGLEPPERRQAYLDDLAAAATQLAVVARQAGASKEAAQALDVINKDLPTYSGLLEAARANNRLGLPVGAAYLRQGSKLMQAEILPAVGKLYQVEAGRLNQAYASGRSAFDVARVLLVAGLVIAGLVFCQIFLARRTNRLFNLPLLVGTLLTLVVLAWSLFAFTASASRLKEARTKGSDPVQLLSSARILLSRAQADENLALVARGSGSQYLADFAAVIAELGPADGSSGLMAEAQRSAPAAASLTGSGSPYAAYLTAHDAVVAAGSNGEFAKAVDLATGNAASDELPAASQLSTALSERIKAAQKVFDVKAAAAAHDLARLSLGVIGLAVLAAGSAFFGLQQRINEYR